MNEDDTERVPQFTKKWAYREMSDDEFIEYCNRITIPSAVSRKLENAFIEALDRLERAATKLKGLSE